jgi:hypothetical protein
MPRKQLLLALMVLFTAGNVLAWQAPGYETPNIMAIAEAAFSFATRLVAIVEPIEKNTPCARPFPLAPLLASISAGVKPSSRYRFWV